MRRLKVTVVAVVAVVFLIGVLQNTQNLDVKVLFFTFSIPGVALLFAVFVIGFVFGLLAAGKILTGKTANKKGDVETRNEHPAESTPEGEDRPE
ncbi:MAG: LapA family protein [Planctomycetota bacterium]